MSTTYIEDFKIGGSYRILFNKLQMFWNCYFGQFKNETNKIKQIELLVEDRTNVVAICLDIKRVILENDRKVYWYKFLISETMQVVWCCMPNKVEIFKLQ